MRAWIWVVWQRLKLRFKASMDVSDPVAVTCPGCGRLESLEETDRRLVRSFIGAGVVKVNLGRRHLCPYCFCTYAVTRAGPLMFTPSREEPARIRRDGARAGEPVTPASGVRWGRDR